ncbi:MAG: DUF2971 domain-containing protein [Fibromonadales bacterium]|nr:DUF2971 domain-containing protein [Fibromonadales bacterium]
MSDETVSREDYVKFKKFLQFFVWQSNKNAYNGWVEKPTRSSNQEFLKHYMLESDFTKITKKLPDFGISFFMCGRFNTELSTYINIKLFNIIGKFENKKIVSLKNLIRLDIPSLSILGDLRKRCEERNKQFKEYSLEDLELKKDYPQNISEELKSINNANNNIENMLNEYLKTYKEFCNDIELAISGPKEQETLKQEMDDFIKKCNENMKQDMEQKMGDFIKKRNEDMKQSMKLYHYTTLTTLKKIIESKKILATHIKYLNDKSEIQYAIDKALSPAIEEIEKEKNIVLEKNRVLNRLKKEAEKQSSIDLYITSLSTKSDDLGQWRGYGKGEDSVCIGFDAQKIIEKNSCNRIGIFKVEYGDKEKWPIDIFLGYLKNIDDILSKHPNEEISDEQYSLLLDILFVYLAKAKDGVWEREEECRVIYNSKNHNIEPEFRIDLGKGYLVPYIKENLYEISEIILPQSDNFESIKIAIKKLLRKEGFKENIEIKESKIPIVYDTPSIKFLEVFVDPPAPQSCVVLF